MAHLIDLVDQLIGDILQGNIYTDIDMYSNALRAPLESPTEVEHQSTFTDTQIGNTPEAKRTEIYQKNSQLPPSIPPSVRDLVNFHEQTLETKRTFSKGEAFNSQLRKEIYKNPDSNIGGTPISKPTDGDTSALEKIPPTSPAMVQVGMSRPDFAPLQGQIRKEFSEAHRLGNLYDDGADQLVSDRGGPFHQSAFIGPLRYFDVFAIAHWFRNIGRETGLFPSQNTSKTPNVLERSTEAITKGITFAASQFLLAAMNPTDTAGYGELNAIWNPLSLPLSMVPFVRSTAASNITLGATLSDFGVGGYKQNVLDSKTTETERLVLMRSGKYVKSVDGTQVAQLRFPDKGFRGDAASVSVDGTETIEGKGLLGGLLSSVVGTSIEQQVDQEGELFTEIPATIHRNIYTGEDDKTKYPGAAVADLVEIEKHVADEVKTAQVPEEIDKKGGIFKVRQLFSPQAFPGGDVKLGQPTDISPPDKLYSWPVNIKDSFQGLSEEVKGFATSQQLHAKLFFAGRYENDDNLVENEPIADNQLYLPFMFQDLRKDVNQFLYFRAFLKEGLSETFTPDWQIERYYGRVDQVPTYMGTMRSLNLAFDVVAWGPSDLPVIYKKLQKLQSMVYPTYTEKGFLKAGPIIRMRIGDLFANEGKKGLPGYITTMDWSFDDGIWNIKEDFKVPRKIAVSLGYTVVHEGNPGVYPYTGMTINADGKINIPKEEKKIPTFGAATFVGKEDGSVDIKVSQANIRRIFQTVRNK